MSSFVQHFKSIYPADTVRKRSIRVRIGDISFHATLKFDGWPQRTIGHLFYAASSVGHYFLSINEFKLESQSGNTQLGSKSVIFVNCDLEIWWMTLTNNWASFLWCFKLCASFQIHLNCRYIPETINSGQNWEYVVPCNLDIWWMTLKNNRAPLLCCFMRWASFNSHHWNQTGVTVRKRPIRVKISDFLVPCDLEIWWMILKYNRAPLLCRFKLYASLHSHHWIPTGVTVQKRPIWVKIGDFLFPVTLKFDGRPWQTIWHLFYSKWSFVHHFKAIGEFKLALQSGNALFGSKSVIFCPLWPWNLTDDLEKE